MTPFFSRLGLLPRIGLILAAVVVPVLGLAGWQAVVERRAAVEDAHVKARLLLAVASRRTEATASTVSAVLMTLAQSAEVRRALADRTCALPLAEVLAELNRGGETATGLTVIDAAGDLACSTIPQAGPANFADRPFFRQAVAEGGFVVSDLIATGRLSGRPVVVAAYPIAGDTGRPIGVVVAAIALRHLAEAVAAEMPPGAVFVAFDRQGRILARHPADEALFGKTVTATEAIRAALAERREGTVEADGPDGVARLYFFHRLGVGGGALHAAVGFPVAALFADADARFFRLLLFIGAVVALTPAVARVFGQILIVRPLRRAAEKFADDRQRSEKERRDLAAEVTERRAVEMSLGQALAALRTVVDNSPSAIVVLDGDGKITTWNGAAAAIFGRPPEATVGRLYSAVAGSEDDAIARLMARTVAGERVPATELQYNGADGRPRDLVVSGAPFCDRQCARYVAAGLPCGGVVVATDVTERRALERQMQQTAKIDALGQLTGGVAHDFNNLLAVILGNADLLEEDLKANRSAAKLAATITKAAMRGAELTKALLAFSRRQPLQAAVVDVDKLVKDLVRMLGRLLGEDVEVRLELAEEVWPVEVDATQLEAALMNLAVNSRDAMPQGGRLTIATGNAVLDADYAARNPGATPGDYVRIAVTDTGTGMAPEVLTHVFEPYFTTKGRGKGTGLGLATVFGFVKQSGGHVKVTSEVGAGTTVELWLPRLADKPAAAEKPADPPPAGGGGETILAVEDDPEVLAAVEGNLRRLGYQVLTAGDGRRALALLEENRVDLVFSDVVMPGGIGGAELARRIGERWPGVKVLLASGFPGGATNGGDAPAVGWFIQKPYRAADLARKLRDLLDS
jgi:PAS domain S-box-containing protein